MSDQIGLDDDANKAYQERYRRSLYHYLCWYIFNSQYYGPTDDFTLYEEYIKNNDME